MGTLERQLPFAPGNSSWRMRNKRQGNPLLQLDVDQITRRNLLRKRFAGGHLTLLSSPFITAVGAIVMKAMPTTRHRIMLLDNSVEYLENRSDENGRVGFLDPNHHRLEWDTFAVVTALRSIQGTLSKKVKQYFSANLSKYRCSNGAIRTWFDKESKNYADYFVNVNICLALALMNKRDKSIEAYLQKHLDEFLLHGSYYYSNTLFPSLLSGVYLAFPAVWTTSPTLCSVLKKIAILSPRTAHHLTAMAQSIVHTIYANRGQESLVPEYFVSKDSSFCSSLLDRLLSEWIRQRAFCDTQATAIAGQKRP